MRPIVNAPIEKTAKEIVTRYWNIYANQKDGWKESNTKQKERRRLLSVIVPMARNHTVNSHLD